MQTNFVSKSPLLLGLFLLLGSLLSALSVVVLYIVQFTVPISLSFGLSLFSLVTLLLSSIFFHIYIKEIFIYYIEVYLKDIIIGSFKDISGLIISNNSYVKVSFAGVFKSLESIAKSLDESQRDSLVLSRSIDTKLTEIGLDISERKKSVEIINKKREEAIQESRDSFKNMIKNIGEMMNENSKDLAEAIKELESQQPSKEDISEDLSKNKSNSDKDLSKTNLADGGEPKLVEELKASDLELSE